MVIEGMKLKIIINPKANDGGQAVIQACTQRTVNVSSPLNWNIARDRRWCHHQALQEWSRCQRPSFSLPPCKSCSDLLLTESDIYSLQHGQLVLNESQMFKTPPVIKLGDHFKNIQQFQRRFKKIPMIIVAYLTVTGDVYFGRNVTLKGTVIVVANEANGLVYLTVIFWKTVRPLRVRPTFIFTNSGDPGLLSGNLNMIVCFPHHRPHSKCPCLVVLTRPFSQAYPFLRFCDVNKVTR